MGMNMVRRATVHTYPVPTHGLRNSGSLHSRSRRLLSGALGIPINALSQEEEKAVLQQIEITDGGSEQNVKDALASFTAIAHEELMKDAYCYLSDALKEVPGGAVTGVAYEKDICIRASQVPTR